MKATLKFDLPEDAAHFGAAIKGPDYAQALWDLDQELRKLEKWTNTETLTIEQVRDMVGNFMSDNNVSFGDEIFQ
jgi:hypothetical protein